jgi:diguanylate cyclase (GGDEF)-like protein
MTMLRRCAASLCVLVGTCSSASAQTTAAQPLDLFELGAPTFTTFSTRDGVPDMVIPSVQTDHDGFVWLSTPQGLARYDGRRWNAIDAPAINGSLGELMTDHEGTLWSAFRDRGIGHFDGKVWHMDDQAHGLASNHVRRISETRNAQGQYELWAATFEAGLLLHENGRWIAAPNNAQLPAVVLSVARTQKIGGHERLWVGTGSEGVWYREDGDWHRLRSDKFDPYQVEFLLASEHDGHEELWISTFGSGLWRLDDRGLRSWTVASGDLLTDELYGMVQSRAPDQDRVIWIASRAGLIRLHNEHVEVFDRRHGLPSNVIRGLSIWRSPDGIDVLWLATESGVARTIAVANQWQTASLMGARSVGVFGALIEPDQHGGERLWVAATADGLGLYEQGHWRYFTQDNGALPDNEVHMIKRAVDDDGKPMLWAGLRNGFLLRVRDGPVFEKVETPWEHHPGETVLDILSRSVDGHRERWYATRQSGLYRWRDGAWQAVRPDNAVGQWRTTALLEQVDANQKSWLWATSIQGLVRVDGEHVTLLGRDLLPVLDLNSISLIPDAAGHPILWLGSAHGGILRVDVTDPLVPLLLPSDLPPPPDETAYGATRDSQGKIYICTNNGVQLLTPQANGGYASRVFTRRDGMLHDECNTNAQFIDAHDRFWTGTLGGLTVFDPAHEIHDHVPKPLKLSDVRIDGTAVPDGKIHVPPGRHDVRLEFALLSWQRENESMFRTQLIGYESEPGPWTTQNSRNFNTLPEGDYTLHVEGRDYAGNLSMPIDFPLSVVPAWWQRSWASLLFALIAGLLVYSLLQWRTRSLKLQRRRLAEEVSGRTAELNEANARLLNLSYNDALTGLSNRRRLLETLETLPGTYHGGSATALIFIDVDHFKNYNDDFGHPAGDETLRCVAQAMREAAPAGALVARYGGEEFACLLPMTSVEQARELAEDMRAAVEACRVALPGVEAFNRVTISAGVASQIIETAADAHRLLREADIALYQAKRDGRNCVRG